MPGLKNKKKRVTVLQLSIWNKPLQNIFVCFGFEEFLIIYFKGSSLYIFGTDKNDFFNIGNVTIFFL